MSEVSEREMNITSQGAKKKISIYIYFTKFPSMRWVELGYIDDVHICYLIIYIIQLIYTAYT